MRLTTRWEKKQHAEQTHLGGGGHAQGVHVACEAGRHDLPATPGGGASSHQGQVLNALPEQLAPVIETPLVLHMSHPVRL